MIRTRSSNSTDSRDLSGMGRILGSNLEIDHTVSTIAPSELDGGIAGFQELRGRYIETHGHDPEARGRPAASPAEFGKSALRLSATGSAQSEVRPGRMRANPCSLRRAGMSHSRLSAQQIGNLGVQVL